MTAKPETEAERRERVLEENTCGRTQLGTRTNARGVKVAHVWKCNRPKWVEHTEHRVTKPNGEVVHSWQR